MELELIIETLIFAVLMGLSAFFSSSETAFFSLNPVQFEQMRRDDNSKLSLIKHLLSEPRRLIVTILIGNEFVNVAASVISASIVISLLGPESKYLNLLIMVPILLLVGEITPKTLALRHNIAFATVQSRPIALFEKLISPIRWVVRIVSDGITTLIVGKQRTRGSIVTEDMLRTLAHEAEQEGVVDYSEARFIDQIFEFSRKTVADVMTPRSAMFCLPVETPMSDIISQLVKSRHSRVPMYREHKDTIVGILYTRDLLEPASERTLEEPGAIEKLLREPLLIPEVKPTAELFETFRRRRLTFAITVDEYGGVTGLVTMKDLLENIFGEFRSLSDAAKIQGIEDLQDGRFAIDGELSVEEFNREMHAHLSRWHVHTVAGLVLNAYGELPPSGAFVELEGMRFIVDAVDQNRIKRLIVETEKYRAGTESEALGVEETPGHPAESQVASADTLETKRFGQAESPPSAASDAPKEVR
ncbi:MAG: HlyC/CorC family transporter [Gammaproteobacteria bacterium]|nr:HlyC/CorC family transporter [Gammaproteobacteria bacterium]